jgi:hypothetical protein
MVKKMVRLALASEYARLTIRRTDINAKVFGEQGTREFKVVFEQAQKELRTRFGMEMVELPAREKTTISQRRGEFGLNVIPFLSFFDLVVYNGEDFSIWIRRPERKNNEKRREDNRD